MKIVDLQLKWGADSNERPADMVKSVRGTEVILDREANNQYELDPTVHHLGRTALQAVAVNGYVEVVQLLLKKGADVNAGSGEGNSGTALQAASENGNLHIVRLLLVRGVAVTGEVGRVDDRTAVQVAAEKATCMWYKKYLATEQESIPNH